MGNWIRGLLGLLVLTGTAMAGDLDDGIALDEPINDDIELGINVSYIISKAKASSLSDQQRSIVDDDDGVVGQGNIIIKPGVRLPPGTIIINNSNINGATAISR